MTKERKALGIGPLEDRINLILMLEQAILSSSPGTQISEQGAAALHQNLVRINQAVASGESPDLYAENLSLVGQANNLSADQMFEVPANTARKLASEIATRHQGPNEVLRPSDFGRETSELPFRVRIGPVAMAANDLSVDLAVTGGSVKMYLDSTDGTANLCQLKFSRQGSKLKVQLLPSSTADASIFDLKSSIAVAHLSKDHPVYVGDFGSLEVTQQLLYKRFKPVRRESNE